MGRSTRPPPWPGWSDSSSGPARQRPNGLEMGGKEQRFKGAWDPKIAVKSLFLKADALEPLVEAGELTGAVDEALLTASPGWVGFRIDFEVKRVAGLAIGRARLVARAVGHHDGDLVIIGMDAVLHRALRKSRGFIAKACRRRNVGKE